MESILKEAEESFMRGDYKNALRLFSEALLSNNSNKEAKIGVLLSDMAQDNEGEAQALYDYYQIIKNEHKDSAEDVLEDILSSYDGNVDSLSKLLKSSAFFKIDSIDGVLYRDFKESIEDRGSFKRAFEDLMFSSKIIISGKDEFIEFMTNLVDNGFENIALGYIENIGAKFYHDKRVKELIDKIKEKNFENRSKK